MSAAALLLLRDGPELEALTVEARAFGWRLAVLAEGPTREQLLAWFTVAATMTASTAAAFELIVRRAGELAGGRLHLPLELDDQLRVELVQQHRGAARLEACVGPWAEGGGRC